MNLKIGEVAKRGGVSLQAIRYYEREGLLPEPPRLDSGYRFFPESTVQRITFIKRAQELGFSLAEIRQMLLLREDADEGPQGMFEFARLKVVSIDEKIEELQAKKKFLSALAECCPTCGPLTDCPVLKTLDARLNCKASEL